MTQNRHFTVAEANRTLPLVKRIVADILATGQKIREHRDLAADSAPEDDPELRALATELHGLLIELEDIGCSYKDWNFAIGLVDFPAIIDGREVLLCWRSDEPEVAHYHEAAAGYSGRRPIPTPCAAHDVTARSDS